MCLVVPGISSTYVFTWTITIFFAAIATITKVEPIF